MVAVAGVLALSTAVSALSIDLKWAGSGTTLTGTNFTGSEAVVLGVYATFGTPPGLSGITASVSYNPAALSFTKCTPANKATPQLVAGGSFEPFLGSSAVCTVGGGVVGLFDQQEVSPYLTTGAGTVHIADITFHVTGAVKGNSIVQSFFHPTKGGWGDNNANFSLNAVFGAATVHVIPEPTTAILVGIGFLGLLAAGRRRRS
jgi:hypothetical protein